MSIYKVTGISAAAAFTSILVACILTPKNQLSDPTLHGDIAWLVAFVFVIVFIIMVIVALVKHKVESVKDKRLHEENNTVQNQLLMRLGRYDEKYDMAAQRHKKEKEKKKFE